MKIYSGAFYDQRRDIWIARIQYKGVKHQSPHLHSKAEAEDWYQKKSFELYGYDRVDLPDFDIGPIT